MGPSGDSELFAHDGVDCLRIGLASGGFHHLPDEPAGQGGLFLRLEDLVGIGCDDFRDGGLDRAGIGNLFQAATLDNVGRVAALGPEDLEDVLGDLAGDVAPRDQVDQAAELLGADRARGDVVAFLVEAAEKLVDDPVRRLLAVAALGHGLEIIGASRPRR